MLLPTLVQFDFVQPYCQFSGWHEWVDGVQQILNQSFKKNTFAKCAMGKKINLIISCLLIVLITCGTFSLNWVQAKANGCANNQEITKFVNRFIGAYQTWISAPISERPSQALPLICLFVDGGNGFYQNDLSQIVDVPLSSSPSILTYTTQLYDKLPLPESVDFQIMGPFRSFRNADDLDLVEVTVKKTMKFPLKTLIHVHKIQILEEPLKIYAVWIPDLQQVGQEFRLAGDKAFLAGQYSLARAEYQRALECYNDPYLNEKIAECSKKLNQDDLYEVSFEAGTRQFNAKNYAAALASFRSAASYRKTKEADHKIRECEYLIAMDSHLQAGDRYQQHGSYSNAISEYQLATKLQPSNLAAKNRLEQCLLKYEHIVTDDLQRSVSQWNSQHYFEAFYLIYQHRTSGKLNGMHYYMLGSLMADNYGGIKRKMKSMHGVDFTDLYMVHSGAMYLFEAYRLGYGDAAGKLCQFRQSQLMQLGLQHICP